MSYSSNKEITKFISDSMESILHMSDADARHCAHIAGIGPKAVGPAKIRLLVNEATKSIMLDVYTKTADAYEALPFHKKIDLTDALIVSAFFIGFIIGKI